MIRFKKELGSTRDKEGGDGFLLPVLYRVAAEL